MSSSNLPNTLRPYTLGITGGIGSGKSTVCRIFATLGIPVYDTDSRAKLLYDTDPILRSEMTKLFGEGIYIGTQIDRARLSAIIFSDSEALARVTALVHPAVRQDIQHWQICLAPYHPLCIIESALLHSSPALGALCDSSLAVIASEETRIARAMRRDQTDRQAILARMVKQLPQSEMLARSTYTITCDDAFPLLPQIAGLLARLPQ